MDTYSYKKIDHKKYVEGKVDFLSNVAAPLLAEFHFLTEIDIYFSNFTCLLCQYNCSAFLK